MWIYAGCFSLWYKVPRTTMVHGFLNRANHLLVYVCCFLVWRHYLSSYLYKWWTWTSYRLVQKSCTCKKWDLIGIPYYHVCACITIRNECACITIRNEPGENHIHNCYTKKLYLKVILYNFILILNNFILFLMFFMFIHV